MTTDVMKTLIAVTHERDQAWASASRLEDKIKLLLTKDLTDMDDEEKTLVDFSVSLVLSELLWRSATGSV